MTNCARCGAAALWTHHGLCGSCRLLPKSDPRDAELARLTQERDEWKAGSEALNGELETVYAAKAAAERQVDALKAALTNIRLMCEDARCGNWPHESAIAAIREAALLTDGPREKGTV